MNSNTIELSTVLARHLALEAAIKEAEAHATKTRTELADFEKNAGDRIRRNIESGMSTGDPFVDEFISNVGLKPHDLEKLKAFSERLMANKDKECLIATTYAERFYFGGDFIHERDTVQKVGWILGQLSGERLGFVKDQATGWSIKFPFSRYVVQGFHDKEDVRKFEPAAFANYTTLRPSGFYLYQSIVGKGNGDEECSHQISIGDEIDKAAEEQVRFGNTHFCRGTLALLRKELYAPTEAEKLAGQEI